MRRDDEKKKGCWPQKEEVEERERRKKVEEEEGVFDESAQVLLPRCRPTYCVLTAVCFVERKREQTHPTPAMSPTLKLLTLLPTRTTSPRISWPVTTG